MDVGTLIFHSNNPVRIHSDPRHDQKQHKLPHDTPYRVPVTSLNIGSRVETHEEVDYLVSEEIKGACFRGITRLEETIFQNNKINLVPAAVLEDLSKGSDPLYDSQKNAWVDWPRIYGRLQTSGMRENAIANCMNRIAAAVGRRMGAATIPREWSAKFANTPVPSKRCSRKPDLVLMDTVKADSPAKKQKWTGIHSSGEDKGSQHLGKALEELAEGARLIFGSQPDRDYVLGFITHQDNMMSVVFNRSGVFISDAFDVDENPERLIRIVGGMVLATREQMGFNPTMKITPYGDTEPHTPYVEVNGNRYEVVQLLHLECVIRCRATVCFKVKKKVVVEDENGVTVERDKFFVVKNGWVDYSREKEPSILQALNEKSVKGIPTVEESQLFAETTNRIFLKLCAYMSPEGREKLSKLLEVRQQVRVVMGPVGSSILEFGCQKELVHGFLKIVESE